MLCVCLCVFVLVCVCVHMYVQLYNVPLYSTLCMYNIQVVIYTVYLQKMVKERLHLLMSLMVGAPLEMMMAAA